MRLMMSAQTLLQARLVGMIHVGRPGQDWAEAAGEEGFWQEERSKCCTVIARSEILRRAGHALYLTN
jgi:hypothetical protein